MARARARFYVSTSGVVVSAFGRKIDALASHPGAVGPFHTKRGAEYWLANPGSSIASAERLSKPLDAPTVSDTIPTAALEATQDQPAV